MFHVSLILNKLKTFPVFDPEIDQKVDVFRNLKSAVSFFRALTSNFDIVKIMTDMVLIQTSMLLFTKTVQNANKGIPHNSKPNGFVIIYYLRICVLQEIKYVCSSQ